jgi:hypothetical protein
MQAPSFRTTALAVVVAVLVTLSGLTPSVADERGTYRDVVRAQELYEDVLRDPRVGGPHKGPYTAPLHTDPDGPSYLWGGLDPISVLDRYDEDIEADPGRVIFISRSGSNLGNPEIFLDLPPYLGAPKETYNRALFRSEDNRRRFIAMTNPESRDKLMIMFGLNCQWGIISGPATGGARDSHWAQPGLAAIAVERFRRGRGTVTVLGLNLYSRGDDWNATARRWKYAIEAFESLLEPPYVEWERERPDMPVIKVN